MKIVLDVKGQVPLTDWDCFPHGDVPEDCDAGHVKAALETMFSAGPDAMSALVLGQGLSYQVTVCTDNPYYAGDSVFEGMTPPRRIKITQATVWAQ